MEDDSKELKQISPYNLSYRKLLSFLEPISQYFFLIICKYILIRKKNLLNIFPTILTTEIDINQFLQKV